MNVLVICPSCFYLYVVAMYYLYIQVVRSSIMYSFYELLVYTSFYLYVLVVCTRCMYYVYELFIVSRYMCMY